MALKRLMRGIPMQMTLRTNRMRLSGRVKKTETEPPAYTMLWVQLLSIILPKMDARMREDWGILYLLKK